MECGWKVCRYTSSALQVMEEKVLKEGEISRVVMGL